MTGSLRARAWAPGTCGELVEGTLEGKPFLITCPIDLGSTVEVYPDGEKNIPETLTKTAWALDLVKKRLDLPVATLGFVRESRLPPGKGMGSSTSDIAAAILAAARLFAREITEDEIADLALSIEPSDGTMFPGVVLFDHRGGQWRERLGDPPPFNILILDPGGVVDTLDFNRQEKLDYYNHKKEPRVKMALGLVQEGLKEQDPEKVARGATESSLANQELLPKPDLTRVLGWAKEVGALGVNVAHSGTVMGLLLPPEGNHPEEVRTFLQRRRPHWKYYVTKLISGGLK